MRNLIEYIEESILDDDKDVMDIKKANERFLNSLGWHIGDVIVEETYSNHVKYVFFYQITDISDQEKLSVIARKSVTMYYRDSRQEYPIIDSFKVNKHYPAGNTLLFQFKPNGEIRRSKVSEEDVWIKNSRKTSYYKWNGKPVREVDISYN